MKQELTTTKQRNAHFLYMEWCAKQMAENNIWISELVLRIRTRPSKENLHTVFKAILEAKYKKKSTTTMTREEYSECLDVWMETMQEIGVYIPYPEQDKKNLLQFYS